jgi:fructokinase
LEEKVMVICIGEAVIDMFHKQDPIHGEVFVPLPGGCCYNTSIAAARLGAQAAFLGRISTNFFGDIQVQRLRENAVNTDLLLRRGENPILAFIKTEVNKQPQYAFYDEGTVDRLLSPDELPDLPTGASCIVFGSISMAMEPIASAIENLIIKSAGHKVIAFDPNIRPFMIKDRDVYMRRFKKWAAFCTIAKISSEDFEYIFPDIKPQDALEKMIDLGTQLAIVTLGPDGAAAMLRRENENVIRVSIPGIHIEKIADTVGAGDTFLGAFLAWLELRGKMSHNAIAGMSEEDLRAALTFANKAAAFVCTRTGAEPPTLEEMEFLLFF